MKILILIVTICNYAQKTNCKVSSSTCAVDTQRSNTLNLSKTELVLIFLLLQQRFWFCTNKKTCWKWKISPSCSRNGETEDPTLENVALDDSAVFLMTVGESSPVKMYNTEMPAKIPNLPSITRDRVTAGWPAWKNSVSSLQLLQGKISPLSCSILTKKLFNLFLFLLFL